MPDDAAHADDISDLWGADQQGALEPVRPSPRATDTNPAHPAAGNGNGGAVSHEELASLVEAIAARQIRAPSRAEFDAVSERITAVQDDVRALHEAVAELKNTVDTQGRRSRARAWLGRHDRNDPDG